MTIPFFFVSMFFFFLFSLSLTAGGSYAKGVGAANSSRGRRALAEHANSVRHLRPHEGRVEWVKIFFFEFVGGGLKAFFKGGRGYLDPYRTFSDDRNR